MGTKFTLANTIPKVTTQVTEIPLGMHVTTTTTISYPVFYAPNHLLMFRVRAHQAKSGQIRLNQFFWKKLKNISFYQFFCLKILEYQFFCLKILEYQFFSVQMLEYSE